MAVDLSSFVTFITSETVMLAVLAFVAGMAGVISYHRLGSLLRKSQYKIDDAVTEAIVSEYSRRLRDYDRVIAELRTKLDIMELRAPRDARR